MPDEFELNLAAYESESKLGTTAVIATLVVAAVAGLCVWLVPKHELKVAIDQVDVLVPGTQATGVSTGTDDGLYVVTSMQVNDELRHPVFLDGTTATLTKSDGSVVEATEVSPHDLPALQTKMPAIAPLLSRPQVPPARLRDAVPPESALEFFVVLRFPGTSKAAWQAKKSANFTLKIAHSEAHTLKLAVTPR